MKKERWRMMKENGLVFKILAQIKCLGPNPSGSGPLKPGFKTRFKYSWQEWIRLYTFQSPLWLGIGVKTSSIKMMIVFDTCFIEAWQWSILNIFYKVHLNLNAVCSTGHIGASRILLVSTLFTIVNLNLVLKGRDYNFFHTRKGAIFYHSQRGTENIKALYK